MSMIAKQAWNFVLEPDMLVARIFKARWKICDGSKIKIMFEPWLCGGDNLWVQSPQTQKSVAASILRIPLFEEVTKDKLVWNYENHGDYTVNPDTNTISSETMTILEAI
ncbi:hypothetical protein A2U01_0001495 [Trifolium medium]|uniref:Uncharacterized protein n=1 Tax=Trifolium medium TaxID=97028 RepID=A0A392M096_9FABA|nr:hypothetical protein [Trifolium medium]